LIVVSLGRRATLTLLGKEYFHIGHLLVLELASVYWCYTFD